MNVAHQLVVVCLREDSGTLLTKSSNTLLRKLVLLEHTSSLKGFAEINGPDLGQLLIVSIIPLSCKWKQTVSEGVLEGAREERARARRFQR